MGEVLQRRFYTVLSRSVYLLIAWLLTLLFALYSEEGEKHFKRHPETSFTFFIMTLPLYSIVLFGCYSLITIGYHMIVLGKSPPLTHFFGLADCKDAQDELLDEIKEARAYLSKQGMKFE